MASYGAYQYICARCTEPLLSSLDNAWLRVSNSHITFSPQSQIEALPNLRVTEDTLSGSKELHSCEIQQVYCENCELKIGVRCIDASAEKEGFIGRYFLREAAIEVQGLTPQWDHDSDRTSAPDWKSTSGVALAIKREVVPLPLSLGVAKAQKDLVRSLEDKDPKASNEATGYEDGNPRDGEMKAFLENHTRALGEVVRSVNALKEEMAVINQNLLKRDAKYSRKKTSNHHAESVPSIEPEETNVNVSASVPSQSTSPPPSKMDMDPPPRPPTKLGRMTHTPSTLNTQQYLEATVISDDPQDSDFELSDASVAVRQQSTAIPASLTGPGGPPQVLQPSSCNTINLNVGDSKSSARRFSDTALQGLKETPIHDRPVQVALRGRTARRGVSGRHLATRSSKLDNQVIPTPLNRGRKVLKPITSHRHPRSGDTRQSGYRSSPLATSFSAEDTNEFGAGESAVSPASPEASFPPHGPPLAIATSIDAMSHHTIMKLVNKGMNSNFAKSHLLRGPTRRATKAPSKASSPLVTSVS